MLCNRNERVGHVSSDPSPCRLCVKMPCDNMLSPSVTSLVLNKVSLYTCILGKYCGNQIQSRLRFARLVEANPWWRRVVMTRLTWRCRCDAFGTVRPRRCARTTGHVRCISFRSRSAACLFQVKHLLFHQQAVQSLLFHASFHSDCCILLKVSAVLWSHPIGFDITQIRWKQICWQPATLVDFVCKLCTCCSHRPA